MAGVISQANRAGADERYLAEWVTKEGRDADGEWQPDRDETETSEHTSLAAAKRAASTNAKRLNVADWARVTLETKTAHGWEEVTSWVGDQRGNWNEVRHG